MTNIFTPPGKEHNYQAYIVHSLTIVWSIVIGVIVSVGFAYFPHIWVRCLYF